VIVVVEAVVERCFDAGQIVSRQREKSVKRSMAL